MPTSPDEEGRENSFWLSAVAKPIFFFSRC